MGKENESKHPSGKNKQREPLTPSPDTISKAQIGLRMLKEAIEEVLEVTPQGVQNTELARSLGLESDFNGGQKNYLTYSILGILLKENRISRDAETKFFKGLTPG